MGASDDDDDFLASDQEVNSEVEEEEEEEEEQGADLREEAVLNNMPGEDAPLENLEDLEAELARENAAVGLDQPDVVAEPEPDGHYIGDPPEQFVATMGAWTRDDFVSSHFNIKTFQYILNA